MAARPQRQPRGTADPARLVAAARTLGDRLEALALHDEESCSWVGLSLVNGRHWSLAPFYVDLYSGTPGIVLFLAHLARQTGEERYLVLAQSALRGFRRQTDRFRDKIESVGAFQGWGGILYLLTALGCLWRQPQLIEEAAAMAATLPALIERDRHYDVVGGAAGCIAALLALHRHAPAASLLDIARACGERLLAAAVREATGVGDAYRTEFDRRSAAILETIESEGARCGVPLGVETPGLLVGLAGIGIGLLRLADPDTVPSVLLLDPP